VKWRHELWLAGLVACRFGGPSANPDQYVDYPDATSDGPTISTTIPPGDDGTSTPSGDDETGAPPGDDGGSDSDSGFDDRSDAGCSSTVAVCDPVHNTGCNPFQQCDVGALQGTMPAGNCVFGGTAEASACTMSLINESCPPKSTCVDGGCQQLCFCNADCPVGQCCSEPGPPGFSLCGACP
jgi:hypothetical protein